MKGCLGIIIIIILLSVVIRVGGCIIDASKKKAGELTEWLDARLAEKARQAELDKARKEAATRDAEGRKKQNEAKVEEIRRKEAKDEKVRMFALKEMPTVWAVYQSLLSEINVQNGKIEDLRKTLLAFGKDPEQDIDFKRICALRDEMVRSHSAIRAKVEDAYIASRKYEAVPSRKDYQELHKKALEDGVREADAATARFKEMRLSK